MEPNNEGKPGLPTSTLPPAIKRKKDPKVEDAFHAALAKAYNCKIADITIEIDGIKKHFKLNGHTIFTDNA